MKKIALLLLVFISFNCNKDDTQKDIGASGYEVDPAFEPYVQDFIKEAAKRGKTIDFSDTGLKVEFSETIVNGASGYCYLGEHHIVIDKTEWYSFNEDIRAFLLFHELGHCALDRLHKNKQFNNGAWESIMRGNPFTGIEARMPTAFYGYRKDYYIDELFNENVAPPVWGNRSFDYAATATKRQSLQQETNLNRLNTFPKEIAQEYEFEVAFDLPTRAITTLYWGASNKESYHLAIIPNWGYYIGVGQDKFNNSLYYSNNISLANGRPIDKISIRQQEGINQIFVNESFVFEIDPIDLSFVRLEATDGEENLSSSFKIHSFELYAIN